MYDSCSWHVLTTQDLSKNVSPCTSFGFWILAACGGSTDCPTNWYPPYPAVWPASAWLLPPVLCMHACMTVTVNCHWTAQCQCFLFCWQKNFMCIFWLHTTCSTCANAPHMSSIAQETNPPWSESCIDALLRVHSRSEGRKCQPPLPVWTGTIFRVCFYHIKIYATLAKWRIALPPLIRWSGRTRTTCATKI